MSRVSGRLLSVKVQRGDAVWEGQLLAEIDDEDLQQQIRRAEASIAVAKAAVRREEASFQNLELQVKRFRLLHEDSLISLQELEDAESRLRVAAAQLELVRAQVDQAEASLRELRVQQAQTRIYSPLSGFVGTRHLDPGALVSPAVSIVTVMDVSRVKTVVPVSELALSKVRRGLKSELSVDAYPAERFYGTVTRVSPFLDPTTRSADVEIEIENESGLLKPGMFARVSVAAGRDDRVLAVPRAALLTRGDEKGVFLIGEGSVTEYRPIRIGRIQGDFVEVIEGLEEGTEVITSGAQKLNNGDKVRTG
jgi:RND family efflux transporter MFP subunit